MPHSKRAQTSTEYLIILAVVIVIALIVVGVLGGIPSIGGGASKNAMDAQMRTEPVGVDNYYVNATYARILLRNNQPDTVTVNKLTIDTMICSPATSDGLPAQLRSGQTKTIICRGDFPSHASGRTAPSIGADYTDVRTGANYFTSRYEEFDYSGFDEIVINSTNHHMWQAGDNGATLAWQTNTATYPYDFLNYSDLIVSGRDLSEYPAIEYCYNLALCKNGSFDASGSCSGAYGGILHSDWRLPAYVGGSGEDYDIYENDGALISFFKSDAFTNKTTHNYYWTGNTHVYGVDDAYYLDLDNGLVDGAYKFNDFDFRARCVRDHD